VQQPEPRGRGEGQHQVGRDEAHLDVRDVVLDGVEGPPEEQEPQEPRSRAVPKEQGRETHHRGRQRAPVEVADEVAPVVNEPARKFCGPEGEKGEAVMMPSGCWVSLSYRIHSGFITICYLMT